MRQAAGNALRQAFMPKDEYDNLREEEKAWNKLARPLVMTVVTAVCICITIAFAITVDIESGVTGHDYPSCRLNGSDSAHDLPVPSRPVNGDSRASYLLTEEEAEEYFWNVVFLPTSLVFGVAVVYLLAGIAVAYTAPQRHPCLRIVENNCCASPHGGVRCLALLNGTFFAVFAMLALFLGSSILTLQTDCSIALFWCYEIICWGTAILLAGSAIFLRRKAAVILDAGIHYGSRNVGVELLEAPPVEPYHVIEERLLDGFKSWSGGPDSDGDQEVANEEKMNLDDVWEDEDESSEISAHLDIMRHRRT